MDKMYEVVYQATYRFFGVDEVHKLVLDEMYQIGWFIVKIEYEYSRIFVASVVTEFRCLSCKSINFVLVVKPTLMSLF